MACLEGTGNIPLILGKLGYLDLCHLTQLYKSKQPQQAQAQKCQILALPPTPYLPVKCQPLAFPLPGMPLSLLNNTSPRLPHQPHYCMSIYFILKILLKSHLQIF